MRDIIYKTVKTFKKIANHTKYKKTYIPSHLHIS